MRTGNKQPATGNCKRPRIPGLVLCVALFAFHVSAEAQMAKNIPRIGYLSLLSADQEKDLLAAFQQGLRDLGYVPGQNIVIEQRYAEGKRDRLAALAAELVRLKVDVFVSGPSGVRAAKKLTSTIPLIFTFSADPVKSGLVVSLARPGGERNRIIGLSWLHIP